MAFPLLQPYPPLPPDLLVLVFLLEILFSPSVLRMSVHAQLMHVITFLNASYLRVFLSM